MLRLKELRKKGKVSQQVLADHLHVARSTVAMWEQGKEPGIEDLLGIANYFDVTVDYLLGKAEPKKDTSPSALPLDEARLLNDYHQLTEEGKARALEYMAFLLQNFAQDSKKTHA